MSRTTERLLADSVPRPVLLIPRAEAEDRIQAQIEIGRLLFQREIASAAELQEARAELRKWSDYNSQLLRQIADTDELMRDYRGGAIAVGGFVSFSRQVADFRRQVHSKLTRLESIVGRLELFWFSGILRGRATSRGDQMSLSLGESGFKSHENSLKNAVSSCFQANLPPRLTNGGFLSLDLTPPSPPRSGGYPAKS